jgi:hypothetical protein
MTIVYGVSELNNVYALSRGLFSPHRGLPQRQSNPSIPPPQTFVAGREFCCSASNVAGTTLDERGDLPGNY